MVPVCMSPECVHTSHAPKAIPQVLALTIHQSKKLCAQAPYIKSSSIIAFGFLCRKPYKRCIVCFCISTCNATHKIIRLIYIDK